ncbi:hypothetical protein CEXT_566511 [Caerostris extrusa]|uniref:Kinase n=1 Tax=Caerostris extrusa TaxID=172846 RepID=A0AAV4Y9L9_CAEEX|nr:hypothetical protein CEXT_566511 [Caerostris extrusa]
MNDESIKNPVNLDNLPDGVELFPYQVAGHKHGKGRLGLGILRHKNGQILKPLFEDNGRAVKEMTFYESVFHNPLTDPLVEELAGFLPVFYGTKCINISGKDIKYLCLEDVSGTFKNPSVLDVKIGPITYEIGASKNKINEQRSKFVHGEVCGIRVVGMKVYDEEKQLHIAQDRMYLRQLSPDTIESALSLYFTKDKFINSLILCGFIHKLLQIDDWFSRQRRFIFIGSSILFVYEGTLSSWKDWIQRELLNCSNNIKNFDKEKSNNADEGFVQPSFSFAIWL